MNKTTKITLALSAAAMTLTGGTVAIAQQQQRGGDITKAQMLEMTGKMFERMDVNSDGKVDAADGDARKDAMFEKLDADSNGEVTQAEMAKAREARQERREARAEKMREAGKDRFSMLDTDKSGGLSKEELAAGHEMRGKRGGGEGMEGRDGRRGGHHKMGHRGKRGMGMAMLKAADTNGDKAVTRAEFDAAVSAHFDRMDTDNSGTVTAAERQAAHEAMKAKWQQKRAS